MSWPEPNEYAEAIQNPKQAFSVYELQNARVVTNKLGLPRPNSGNFATVFEVEDGIKRWAVRCFLRDIPNQQQRYTSITEHLKKHTLPYMVGFEYLPQGIKVNQRWYPILKMDWISGSQLDGYLQANLNEMQKLQKLAEQWIGICNSLRQSYIAHSDLQHGNILITPQDEIKLIDYDGIYIPDVIGLLSSEIGHRHYQHPTRISNKGLSSANYQNLDNFSAHVIGFSLFALSIDPTLWQKTKAGEEHLLFKDIDYKNPKNSDTLAMLQKHPDERIRAIALGMVDIIKSASYLDVPSFGKLKLDGGIVAKGWFNDHLSQHQPALNFTTVTRPSWLLDHIEAKPTELLDFSNEFVLAVRQVIETEFQNSLLRWFRPLFRQFASSYIAERFPYYPIASDKVKLQVNLANLEKQRSQVHAKLKTLNRQQEDAKHRLDAEIKQMESDLKKLSDDINTTHEREKDEIAKLDENQLEQHYRSRLSHYSLAPNMIAGIGPARISALNSVGIYTAADIISANESKGRSALAGVRNSYPSYEWRKLEQWREQLKQTIPKPSLRSFDPNAAKNISEKYSDLRHDLRQKHTEKKQQLNDATIISPNTPQITALNQEISKTRLDLSALEWRIKEVQIDLKRYQKITPANLLNLILKI